MIVLHDLPAPLVEAWTLLLDLTEEFPDGWALVGGLMVHAHCYERGTRPPRVTDDADIGVDLSAVDGVMPRLTGWIEERGYVAGQETDAHRAHRWSKDAVLIDILVPEHQADIRSNATNAGRKILASPGLKEAIDGSIAVEVDHAGRSGSIRLPELMRAIVAKCATLEIASDPADDRHVSDVVTLSTLLRPDDVRPLSAKDKARVRTMLARIESDLRAWALVEGGEDGVAQLRQIIGS